MRFQNVAKAMVWVVAGGLCFGACAPRPERVLPDQRVDLPSQYLGDKKAIWFATSDASRAGALARLDLRTGEIAHRVVATGPDVVIQSDGASSERLFALTRTHLDAIEVLEGADGHRVARVALAEGVNPQSVARDGLGRVWVASLDSNQVQVFAPDLSAVVGQVDLTALREEQSTDGYAELARISRFGPDHMVVSAQRLRRGPKMWAPEAQSGIAVIRADTLAIEEASLVDLPNPQALVASAQSTVLTLFGAGVRSRDWLAGREGVWVRDEVPYRVLSVSEGALLAWYPAENRSCIQVGARELVCDGNEANGGYIFSSILRAGEWVFAAYVGSGEAQLWMVPVAGIGQGAEVKKYHLGLPALSMCFGE